MIHLNKFILISWCVSEANLEEFSLFTQETGSIFSFSQDLLSLAEIGLVLSTKEVSVPIKHAYVSFLLSTHIMPATQAHLKTLVQHG